MRSGGCLLSSSLPFNSCRSTGRRRYSATPPDLVPSSPLRSSSVSCFPAPSHLSSSMCTLVFLCLDNLEGSISELFRYTAASFPHCMPNPSPLPTSNRCLHGILLSYVPRVGIVGGRGLGVEPPVHVYRRLFLSENRP